MGEQVGKPEKRAELVWKFKEICDLHGFQGLRTYKEKFKPVWEPRYLASPGRLALPAILFDTAALISGGVKVVFSNKPMHSQLAAGVF